MNKLYRVQMNSQGAPDFSTAEEVEAVPVVHGRWVKQNPLVDTEECSHCGYNIISTELETPFCPWCGAAMKMDGGEE